MKWPPAVVAALATAALIAARLLAISRFDVNTAAMILQVSGTGTALAGTTLTLLPVALFIGTVFLAMVVFLDPSLLRTEVPTEWMLIVAAAASVCLTPWPFAVATASVLALVWLAGRISRRRGVEVSLRQQFRDSRMLRVMLTVMLSVFAIGPIVAQRPWLPLQVVTLEDSTVVVGYVLGEAEGRVVVMSDRDRTIALLDPEEIDDRAICQGGARPGGALAEAPQVRLSGSLLGLLLWGDQAPSYPECPDGD
jgi:hypothetical protein